MKITESRNKREGRYCGKFGSYHRRDSYCAMVKLVPYPNRDIKLTRAARKRDKMQPFDYEDGCPNWTPF